MSQTARPRIHYTARSTWLNDPNGLIHRDGEWHLYYQTNPYGNAWGSLSWGHAVSRDLVFWDEQDVALRATDEVHYFSGSCVDDRANTSGLGRGGVAPLVAVFTEHYTEASSRFGTQAQGVAYSLDRGRTFTRYPGNPVLCRHSPDFRDPKVTWVEPFGYWLMTAVEATQNVVTFYRSENLLDWTLLSEFGPANATAPTWECPDLFPLVVEGTDTVKWVLIVSVNPGGLYGGSGVQYFVGEFDGVTFTAAVVDSLDPRRYHWLDHGTDFYAAVTFNDAPAGRRVAIGWMSNWAYAQVTPTSPWRGAMAIPRELRLVADGDRYLLCQQPVPELSAVMAGDAGSKSSPEGCGPTTIVGAAVFDAYLPCPSVLGIGTATLTYDAGRLTIDRSGSDDPAFHEAYVTPQWVCVESERNPLPITIVADAGSIEVFVDGGRYALSSLVFPASDMIEITTSPGVEVGPISTIGCGPVTSKAHRESAMT